MKQLKQLDQTKAVRILLLLLLDAVMINLASFLALFVRMELNMTAVRESGFLTSVFRYAPLDTICTGYTTVSGRTPARWSSPGLPPPLWRQPA